MLGQQRRFGLNDQLRNKATNAGDFSDTGNRTQLWSNRPVLQRPQPGEVVSFSFNGVPVDLSGRNSVCRKLRSHSIRQIDVGRCDSLPDQFPRPVKADMIFKDHMHHRITNVTRPANDTNSFQPLQLL